MTPRDLDPDALERAQNAVLLADGWEPEVIARERGHKHPLPQIVKVCEDVERGITAYLNALGLVMVPELKTGVPGKGEGERG